MNFASQGLHVAIIMDGNGRWAQRRGLKRTAGHRAGVATVRRIVEHALERNVRRLTLYAFSSDNWRRPLPEVQSIFWLLRAFLRLETRRLRDRGARLQVIGRRDRLAKPVLDEIEKSERATAEGSLIHICVAIDYSSRDSMVQTVCETLGVADRTILSPQFLSPLLAQAMSAQTDEVDLLIRTGGEKRLSDFMLWESAYAELLFTDCMWPDFSEADFDAALYEFGRRQRRFGGVLDSEQVLTVALHGNTE
jgi:undecaprenyl diphosphate synthase